MKNRRLEGRDEPIIEPGLKIIDAHHHLWLHPTLSYMLDDYMSDASAGHNIVASVYVETMAFARPSGPEILRPIGEIEFANGAAAMALSGKLGTCRACEAIVGYADLTNGEAIGEFLDLALQVAPTRFRGIRQVTIEDSSEAPYRYILNRPQRGVMGHPLFSEGLRALGRRGLSFDSSVFHHQLPALARVAEEAPEVRIVLNHMGLAMALDTDIDGRRRIFQEWQENLNDIARRPNVFCKIGGLGLPFWNFGFEEQDGPVTSENLAKVWKPFVESAIAAFGPDRCMMESNFSADARSCGFVPLWNALKRTVAGCSDEEKSALFFKTAASVYRIDV
ncbi:amidohydrolase family protein [Paraburkholderia sp. HD33-4]|uniref:amidohydrolase family protein n=1 Tax=Paraburkholderia sp. HD33-4 TaxID=2883242 RepID=UPI001F1DC9D7|nr:amidohydrolase family protein [Paraburkholderia sp. HD33-4]